MTEARFPYPMLTSIDGGPDDLERLRRQREETVRLGLVKTARDEGVGSLISSFVGCVTRIAFSAASISTPSPAQGVLGTRGTGVEEDDDGEEEEWIRSTTAQNFAAVVESTGIKLPLDPSKGVRFDTVSLEGVGCPDAERVEWFRRHGYVADELFPHLRTDAGDDGNRRRGDPTPPTLEELLDAGLRLEHLIDRKFASPACFRGFVEHYRFGADKFERVFGVRTPEQWRSLKLTPEEVRRLKELRVAAQARSALASPSRPPAALPRDASSPRNHAVKAVPASASSASSSPARGVVAASRSLTPASAPRVAAPYRQESPSLKPRPVLLEASAWSTPPPKTAGFVSKPTHQSRASISPSPRTAAPVKTASAW